MPAIRRRAPSVGARDADALAADRASSNARTIARLESAAASSGSLAARYASARLQVCSAPENIYIGRDFANKTTGEAYDSVGPCHGCGLRYCALCCHVRARKESKKYLQLVLACQLQQGHVWQLITLTAPPVSDAGLIEAAEAFNEGFASFIERAYTRATLLGGTRHSDWTRVADGYHFHIHMLAFGPPADEERLSYDWTPGIEKAWRRRGRTLTFATRSNAARVDVRVVQPEEGETLEDALSRCCRYVFKAEPWECATDEDLLRVTEGDLPGMASTFGSMRVEARSFS